MGKKRGAHPADSMIRRPQKVWAYTRHPHGSGQFFSNILRRNLGSQKAYRLVGLLPGRAGRLSITAEHAAVTRLRPGYGPARRALPEIDAGIPWHRLLSLMSACGTGNCRRFCHSCPRQTYARCPTPSRWSVLTSTVSCWQQSASRPFTTTAGTRFIPYYRAFAWAGFVFMSWTCRSQLSQMTPRTVANASSQTEQPAVKTSTVRFAITCLLIEYHQRLRRPLRLSRSVNPSSCARLMNRTNLTVSGS
jgi:hypothetical protein